MAVRIFIVTLTLMLAATLAPAAERFEQQLRKECDALCAIAIQRPYGAGFDPSGRPDSKRPTTRPVSLDAMQTPAAATVLLWAGQFLGEPRYVELAQQIARATALGQSQPGKFPSYLIFGGKPTGRDEPALVPDRAPTLASLGLILAVLEAAPEPDPRLTSAAQRATAWISKQRTPTGAWPSAYSSDGTEKGAIRLIALDHPDYRNCLLALLLAGEALNDADHTAAAVKSLENLVSLRVTSRNVDRPTLWAGAYDLAGNPATATVGLPDSVDLLASRYSMQALLAGYLLIGDRNYGLACDDAAKAIADLKTADGDIWRRFPDAREAREPPPMFGNSPAHESGPLGIPPTLNSVRQLKQLGREQYLAMLTLLSARQQIVATLVGLRDLPLANDLPVSPDEVKAYLEKHAGDFAILDGLAPEILAERTRRLWLLLIRARLEKLGG